VHAEQRARAEPRATRAAPHRPAAPRGMLSVAFVVVVPQSGWRGSHRAEIIITIISIINQSINQLKN